LPQTHPLNVQTVEFKHESQYEVVLKEQYDEFVKKYGSAGAVIRKSAFDETEKKQLIEPNF
jgi:hypothetical protein